MSITRRGLLAGILSSGFAPAIAGSGVLMPVREITHRLGRFGVILDPGDPRKTFYMASPRTPEQIAYDNGVARLTAYLEKLNRQPWELDRVLFERA